MMSFLRARGLTSSIWGDKPVANGALSLKPKRAYSLAAWQGAGGKW